MFTCLYRRSNKRARHSPNANHLGQLQRERQQTPNDPHLPSFLFSSSRRSTPVWPSRISNLRRTCCGLHEQRGEQEIEGKNRVRRCRLTKNPRKDVTANDDGGGRQRRWMTAAESPKPSILLPSLFSYFSRTWIRGAVIGLDVLVGKQKTDDNKNKKKRTRTVRLEAKSVTATGKVT